MNYLQNHIWCSSSNWGGEHYDCRHLVSISRYKDYDVENWKNLIDPNADTVVDQQTYDVYKKMQDKYPMDDDEICKLSQRYVINLKPNVLQWLHDNVSDRADKDTSKGWAVGSLDYRAEDSASSFSVFFHRRKDAMAFIKEFSIHKKPVTYCQYFADVRKKLDLKTGKYIIL